MMPARPKYKFGITLAFMLLLLAAACLTPAPVARMAVARDYSFPELVIDVEVAADGSFLVSEQRTVRFRGAYSGLYQWINLRDNMQITDVTVAENGEEYRYNEAHDIGPAGTYYTEKQNGRQYIDWSFSANDETRTFTISYRVHNAILLHDDVAELYYQFVGDGWDKPVSRVLVTVHLPAGAEKEDILAWGHGSEYRALHGEVRILDNRMVQWEIAPLPARTMLEGRVVFPLALVPAASAVTRTGRPGLAVILAEEERLTEQANQRRQKGQADGKLAMAVVLAGLGAIFLLWFRFGKAYPVSFSGDYYRELPANYSPAELGVLWRMGQVHPSDLSATLLDLARRRVIRLEEYQLTKSGLFRQKTVTDYRLVLPENTGNGGNGENGKGTAPAPPDAHASHKTLAPHEQSLLDLLFYEIGGGGREKGTTVTLDQLQTFAKKHQKRYLNFWRRWQREVQNVAAGHRFFDEDNMRLAKVIGILSGLIISASAVPAFISNMPLLGLALLLAGFGLLLTGALIKRRTMSGNEDYVRWKAFQRFLRHFSELSRQEIPALVIWEHYLVYAVTLGVAKEVLKQLTKIYPNLEDGSYRFGYHWYGAAIHVGDIDRAMIKMTESLQCTIAESIRLATSQASSGRGFGGGFTGGGGGGFGGGGGGAR